MAYSNPFAAALAAHDMGELRAAFEACQEAGSDSYDRTTLNRWLDGSIPTRADFIRRLAEALDDPDVLEAWQQARDARSPSRARSAVSRFEGLTADEKDWAFHEIRRDYVAEYPSVRSRLTYRIEINDPPDPDDDHFRVDFMYTWNGDIQADAVTKLVLDQAELGDAYADPACVFREVLPFETDRLQTLLEGYDDQVMAITPLDRSNPRASRHVGRPDAPGVHRFDNEAASEASVTLSLSYPYPRGMPLFFIRFGRYQVPDTAEMTLTLNSRSLTRPEAFPFMPPGRQREWTSNLIRPHELFVSLGTGNTVLSEGDGVVLHWTEER